MTEQIVIAVLGSVLGTFALTSAAAWYSVNKINIRLKGIETMLSERCEERKRNCEKQMVSLDTDVQKLYELTRGVKK